MPRRLILAALPLAILMALPAHAQTPDDSVAPTIPETQIEGRTFSSPYEFLSAASSVDDFQIKSAALAESLAESADIKRFAATAASEHAALTAEMIAAAKTEKVEIAQPSVDGEQKGLLSKLEARNGASFDKSYVEAQLFVHQRAIAMYRGYAAEDNALGTFAAAHLPTLVGHYAELVRMARALGVEEVSQPPAQ
jgi:putative membrane protein